MVVQRVHYRYTNASALIGKKSSGQLWEEINDIPMPNRVKFHTAITIEHGKAIFKRMVIQRVS
jgi:hypothetical protein